jgi:GT2 family glycosyltransferase
VSVDVILPVFNGERTLNEVLEALLAQGPERFETVWAIDDGSTDGSGALLEAWAARDPRIRILKGAGEGAAAAINLALGHSTSSLVCQVDQDVVLLPGWLQALLEELGSDRNLAAVQGYYVTDRKDPYWARVMGLDLEQRWASLGRRTDHACTGITAYRRSAFATVGVFDASFGYGSDNDWSYRATAAGLGLGFCREARAIHRWRPTLRGYLRQQYGVGYGRLELVRKHWHKRYGDQVSGALMMLHAPVMLGVLAGIAGGLLLGALGSAYSAVPMWLAGLGIALLGLERLVAGLVAYGRFRDPVALTFFVAHLFRDVAFASALAVWILRTLKGRQRKPEYSTLARRRPL